MSDAEELRTWLINCIDPVIPPEYKMDKRMNLERVTSICFKLLDTCESISKYGNWADKEVINDNAKEEAVAALANCVKEIK